MASFFLKYYMIASYEQANETEEQKQGWQEH